jgi:nucleoside-diphosphate-sugar epimerase
VAPDFVYDITRYHYDAIVDFMTYNSLVFRNTVPKYLAATDQYMYLSSCRVYANEEIPIKEDSPRLIDVTTDPALLFSDDYCMYKARGENTLRALKNRNWTIIRPSTTYWEKNSQLITLGRRQLLPFFRSGKPLPLYEGAKDIPASLTFGRDVAEMIKRLLFKESALGQDYNVTSSEFHTWGEIADYYHEIYGLNYIWTDELTYLRVKKPDFNPERDMFAIWQLRYARMFNRVYDNTKILEATGLKQDDFVKLYDGLSMIKSTILTD